MPFTANFPRKVVETRFPFEVGFQDWLFSIIDPTRAPVKVHSEFDQVFTWSFADVEFGETNAMRPDQAQRMAHLIREAKQLNKNVWVHCTAGICRSGAVVEVLGHLGWTVVNDFSPARVPNAHVFNLLRLQFPELRQSWEEGEWIEWAICK